MAASTANRPRILLLGWDAADWDVLHPLVREGEMPAFAGLMERGVWGNLATLQPMVSPMLWTSIATGKTADKHGVHGFYEPDPESGGARPWSSLSRRCKALWNILHQSGWRCHTTGWWATHPAEPLRGVVAANTFANTRKDRSGKCIAPAGSIHPPEWIERLAMLRMFPEEVTDAHLLPFIPEAAGIDQEHEANGLLQVAKLLTDCVTVQSVATEIMEAEPWDFAAVYFDGIDHFCHGFMQYHPPKRPHISERHFRLYKDVVRGAYKFHDMMLERLLQIAGPETTVILCSDHGFLSGVTRPLRNPDDPAGPTLWHRDMGMLVMAGPGVKRGGQIHGASLLDITPTVLALAGLPAGADMPGKPLADALDGIAIPPRIESWENVEGDAGQHPPGKRYGVFDSDAGAMTQQLVALGYLEDTRGDKQRAAEAVRLEADYNLAQVHLAHGRPEAAVELLEPLLVTRPWETRYIHQLANACARAGWYAQAEALLVRAWPPENPELAPAGALLVMARCCAGRGDGNAAWFYTVQAAKNMPVMPGICVDAGKLAFSLGKTEAAEQFFRRGLALDPDFASAWAGMAAVHLKRHEDEEALECALEAIQRIYQLAEAHLSAGVALARLGNHAEARVAFERVTVMQPRQPHAWRFLAALPLEAGEFARDACRLQARILSRRRADEGAVMRKRAQELRPIPDIPSPAERDAAIHKVRPPPDAEQRKRSGRILTLVSGLPRSGTSLMMQMLAAGGLAPQTDGERAADDDNPEGYYEWEALKRIAREPSLLDDLAIDRRAVKCISALLPLLPMRHRYRVVFMSRPAEEIERSQQRMIERRGTTGMDGDTADQVARLRRHHDETLAFLKDRPRIFDVLVVDYPSLVADPAGWTERILAFIGPDLLPSPEAMTSAVRPELRRNVAGTL